MVWIGFITVLACLDLCLKELIEERKNEEFPKNLEGSRGKIILHKSHNSGFPFGFLKEKQELVKLVPVAAASAVFGVLAYLMGKGTSGRKNGLFPDCRRSSKQYYRPVQTGLCGRLL